MLALNETGPLPTPKDDDELLNEKLSHLKVEHTTGFKRVIEKYPEVVANSFEDVPPSTMSANHSFVLTSNNPIYQKSRRMSSAHHEIVKKEFEQMCKTGIITQVESPWTFPVVIATKKDGSPRFCLGY